MKKILSTVLASAMALSLSSVAFAVSANPDLPNNGTTGGTTGGSTIIGSTVISPDNNKPSVKDLKVILPYGYKGEIDIAPLDGFPIYTWGNTDSIEFSLVPTDATGAFNNAKITAISAHVGSGNVTVHVNKNSGTTFGNGTAPTVKIKANSSGTDFKYDEDFNDLSIDLDLTMALITDQQGTLGEKKDVSITLKADDKTAYSKTQELLNDESITVSKANGSIVKFSEPIVDKTRIRANEYVDVYFKGNYGTDKENMRVFTDVLPEVQTYFEDSNLNFYDFAFTPKFASSVQVAVGADENAFIYEYNKKTGDIKQVKTTYENNTHRFETKVLGTYIASTDEYEDGNVKGDVEDDTTPDETPDETPDNGGDDTSKPNPGTGASDVAGASAAMAVLALTGIGAVAVKKASK